jgi:hypothetical protein
LLVLRKGSVHVSPCHCSRHRNHVSLLVGNTFLLSFYLWGRREPRLSPSAFEAVCTLTPVLVPPFNSRGVHTRRRERPLLAKGGIMGEKWPVKFSQTIRLPRSCWVLLHAAKLRHGTGGFTSPPKEGTLRSFSPEKFDGFGRV